MFKCSVCLSSASSEASHCVAMSVSIEEEKERKRERGKSPNGEMPRFGRFDSQVGSVRHSVRVASASVHPFNQKLAAVQDLARLMRRSSEAPFTFELRSHIILLQLQIRTYRVMPFSSRMYVTCGLNIDVVSLKMANIQFNRFQTVDIPYTEPPTHLIVSP